MDKIEVTQWRKKPVVIEAYQFENKAMTPDNRPNWLMDAVKAGTVHFHGGKDEHLTIKTLEGEMRANIGDWIIKGVQGELYPCKPDIFAKTYEPALATRTDATPVAWMPMTSSPMDDQILAAIKVRHRDGHSWWERHIIVIDSETGTISDMDFHHGWEAEDYEFWQPLPAAPDATYTHPPATDVAALVEAAKWAMRELRGKNHYTHTQQALNCFDQADAALAPFTKGQP